MLTFDMFIAYASNDCKPLVVLTHNTYVVSRGGRIYHVTIDACGRFIYRIECNGVVTDMPPLKSRATIAAMLPSTMLALFEAVDAHHVGVLELPCNVPDRVLETRYDHWSIILEAQERKEAQEAAYVAGAEARNIAYLERRKQERKEAGPGERGRNLFRKLAAKQGVTFDYVPGRYEKGTKTVIPCEVTLTAPIGQIWSCQTDVTTIRGQSHRAATDWLYLRTCLYNELDGMHEPKWQFDRSKYTV